MKKKKGPFKTGFWFGLGFMVAAYLTMFFFDMADEAINFIIMGIKALLAPGA